MKIEGASTVLDAAKMATCSILFSGSKRLISRCARAPWRSRKLQKPAISRPQLEAAAKAARWCLEQRRKVSVMIADTVEQVDLADECGDGQLAESLLIEKSLLGDLYDDLALPRYVGDFLSLRASIEQITEGVETPTFATSARGAL